MNYTKQLEKENEELRQRLANAELIQDVMKFAESESFKKLKLSNEAILDLQNMHGIDMNLAIREAAFDIFRRKLDELI